MTSPKSSVPSSTDMVTEDPYQDFERMLQNSKDLIRYRIIGRYGGYVAKNSTSTTSGLHKSIDIDSPLPNSLREYWIEVHQVILQEQSFEQQEKEKGRKVLCFQRPTITAIKTVARRLSFDEDELWSAIIYVAKGHQDFHSRLIEMMGKAYTSRIARTIFEDLRYLDNELDEITGGIAYRLRPIIVGFKETCFDTHTGCEGDSNWWEWVGDLLEIELGQPVVLNQYEVWKAGRELRREKRKVLRERFGWSEAGLLERKKRQLIGGLNI